MSLRKNHSSFNLIGSPRCTRFIDTSDVIKNYLTEGTSFCTCQKASLTLEAAIIIPLTAGFLACILFLFRILQVQAVVEEALIFVGRETAIESSITSSEEVLFLSAEGFLCYALSEEPLIGNYVSNGVWGVSLAESEFSGETIVLRASYSVKLPVSFFGFDQVDVSCQNVFRKWQGDAPEITGDGEWVYITPTGSVYHRTSSCQVLDLSVNEVSIGEIENLRGANGQKYYICSFCGDMDTGMDTVFCTDYGSVYHKNILCSSLKRTISKVLLSEVIDRSLCSFCGS